MSSVDHQGEPRCELDALLDPRTLEMLRSARRPGGPDPVLRVSGVYLEAVPALLEDLNRALEAGKEDIVRRTAHTLRGSSATLGATRLREIFAEIESRAGSLDAAQACFLLQCAASELRRIQDAFEHTVGRASDER
jgi:HPt (histidine-containing phosphotransfer) domain-containing protein